MPRVCALRATALRAAPVNAARVVGLGLLAVSTAAGSTAGSRCKPRRPPTAGFGAIVRVHREDACPGDRRASDIQQRGWGDLCGGPQRSGDPSTVTVHAGVVHPQGRLVSAAPAVSPSCGG